MIQPLNQQKTTWLTIDSHVALTTWVIFLSAIFIPVSIIANFNMGYGMFQVEMAEHWIGYKPPAPPNAPPPLSVSDLERTYNMLAHAMNHVCARITGGMVINGVPEQVSGSGVIIADQYMLTNYHVVGNAVDIQVTVYTPENTEATYSAVLVMVDKVNDLALLKVNSKTVLPSADLGNSDTVNPGDMVFAMGNAFGSGNVFTTGMIVDRSQPFTVNGRTYNNMIRTESYTYPGSSGGPLANVNGEVIGINTAIYSPDGKFTGISFAMPINRAMTLLRNSGVPELGGSSGGGMAVGFPNDRFLLPVA